MPAGWSIVGCWKVRTTSLPLGPGGACKSSAYTAGSSLVIGLGLGLVSLRARARVRARVGVRVRVRVRV